MIRLIFYGKVSSQAEPFCSGRFPEIFIFVHFSCRILRIMKTPTSYDSLPDGYAQAGIVDLKNNRQASILLNVFASIPLLIAYLWVSYAVTERGMEFSQTFFIIAVFFSLYIVYIILHELTHGIVYSLRTGHKLCFGFDGLIAWCGVPGIYVSRKTAIEALVAPLLVYSIVFGLLIAFVPSFSWKMIFVLLLTAHLGGCAGDIYDTWLLAFRYNNPKTLMLDDGPVQRFYEPIDLPQIPHQDTPES